VRVRDLHLYKKELTYLRKLNPKDCILCICTDICTYLWTACKKNRNCTKFNQYR